jgi:uncharacterized protein YecE (DUF72 family)
MIYLGTSGYSYDDWKGLWYPPALPKSEMLEFYADRFNSVEINSTFYRIPPPRLMDSLVQRAGKRLVFAVKVPQQITHEADLSDATVTAFLRSIEPVAQAGRLGALLAQFPFRFHATPENRIYVEKVAALLAPHPLVIEIRHVSWDADPAVRFFSDRRLNRCITDMPRLKGLPATITQLTGPIAYVRFHGRNGARWFESNNAADPYDYLYSRDELTAWVEPFRELERKSETAFAFFNNHIRAQAPANASDFRELLGLGRAPEPYTDLFGPPRP